MLKGDGIEMFMLPFQSKMMKLFHKIPQKYENEHRSKSNMLGVYGMMKSLMDLF